MPEIHPDPVLFLVVLGGRTPRAHIELHDVRFVAGATIEDTYPALREQWFGSRRGLHLDSYMAVRFIDGWQVVLRRKPAPGPERLWFVNLGAYDPADLAERHRFGLVVARTPQAARARARRRWLVGAQGLHSDDLHAVDDLQAAQAPPGATGGAALEPPGSFHVHLIADPACRNQPLVPDWFGYRRIDRG